MSEYVQNIRQSHELHHRSHVKLKGRINNWRKNFSRGENSERPLLGRCIVIAMMPLNYILRKFTGDDKVTKSQEKINHLMYTDIIKPFTKIEK